MKTLKDVGIGLAAIAGLSFVLAELGFAFLGLSWLAWVFGDAIMNTVVDLLVWTTGAVGGLVMIIAVLVGIIERRRARGAARP